MNVFNLRIRPDGTRWVVYQGLSRRRLFVTADRKLAVRWVGLKIARRT